MLRLAASTLCARKGGTIGALAAVSMAVILVVSCGILLDSSLRAPIAVERLDNAAVVIQANPSVKGQAPDSPSILLPERSRLPAGLARRATTVRGVEAAVVDRSIPIQIIDRGGRFLSPQEDVALVAHGWDSAALTPYRLTQGHPPRNQTDVVLEQSLTAGRAIELGDTVSIQTSEKRSAFRVVGIARSHHASSREVAVFVRPDVAERLAGIGERAHLIGLLLTPGTDPKEVASRVKAELGQPGLRVLTGSKRGEAESPEGALNREDTMAGLTVFAFIAAFVAIFVVASTFALSVQQRHRELALFRAIGSTPRQVRRMVAAEALLISLAAVVISTPLTILAAHLEQGLFTQAGMLPAGLHIVVGWRPFAAGLLAAVVTTQLAAFASARRASKIRPTDALREATVQRRPISWIRGLLGLAVLGGGFVVLTTASHGRESSAPVSALVWMLAVALLGPALAWPFAWLIGTVLAAASRGPGLLAGANTRSNLRRVASVATPLMLAVSLASTIFFGKAILQQQTTRQTTERTTADYVLETRQWPGLPRDTASSVRRLPGVEHASGSFATSVIVAVDGNVRALPARGVDATTLPGVLNLGVASGSLADLRDHAIAVGTDTAKLLGWQTGKHVTLRLGDGTQVKALVAATYARPLGFADVLLPRALAAHHVTSSFDDLVFVKGTSGAQTALQTFASKRAAVRVVSRSQYESSLEAGAKKQALEVFVLIGLVIAFCALAVVNAVWMSTAERAREFALLRLVGAGKTQVRAMVRAETLIMLTFGLTIGTIIAIPGLAAVSRDLTGSAVPSVSLRLYAVLAAAFTVLTFAAGIIPARLALRMDPVKAMNGRE